MSSASNTNFLVSDAQTKEVYKDDGSISKNASVIIARVPSKGGNAVRIAKKKKVMIPGLDGVSNAKKETLSEAEKLQGLLNQPAQFLPQSQLIYKPIVQQNRVPPPGYICHRCQKPGHFIQDCPTNGDPKYDIRKVRPSTGIPRAFLRVVGNNDVVTNGDNAVALPGGNIAIVQPNESEFEKEIISSDSRKLFDHRHHHHRTNEKENDMNPSSSSSLNPSSSSNSSSSSSNLSTNAVEKEKEREVPLSLRCDLCGDIYKEAVLVPCCGETFCRPCILKMLEGSHNKCPNCSKEIRISKLIPNKKIRESVDEFNFGIPPKKLMMMNPNGPHNNSNSNNNNSNSNNNNNNMLNRGNNVNHRSGGGSRGGGRGGRFNPFDNKRSSFKRFNPNYPIVEDEGIRNIQFGRPSQSSTTVLLVSKSEENDSKNNNNDETTTTTTSLNDSGKNKNRAHHGNRDDGGDDDGFKDHVNNIEQYSSTNKNVDFSRKHHERHHVDEERGSKHYESDSSSRDTSSNNYDHRHRHRSYSPFRMRRFKEVDVAYDHHHHRSSKRVFGESSKASSFDDRKSSYQRGRGGIGKYKSGYDDNRRKFDDREFRREEEERRRRDDERRRDRRREKERRFGGERERRRERRRDDRERERRRDDGEERRKKGYDYRSSERTVYSNKEENISRSTNERIVTYSARDSSRITGRKRKRDMFQPDDDDIYFREKKKRRLQE